MSRPRSRCAPGSPFETLDVRPIQEELAARRCASTDRAGPTRRADEAGRAVGPPARAEVADWYRWAIARAAAATRTSVGHPSHSGRPDLAAAGRILSWRWSSHPWSSPTNDAPPRVRPKPPRAPSTPGDPGAAPTRADALRRIAAEVSGRQDLAAASSTTSSTRPFALFGVDRAGLWLYDRRAHAADASRAQRGLSPRSLDAIGHLPRPTPRRPGWMPSATVASASSTGRCATTTPTLRAVYRSHRGPDHLLRPARVRRRAARPARALPPTSPTRGRPTRRALARAFGDQMATAIGSARLADSRRTLADRLTLDRRARPAGSASSRTSTAIAWAIVAEAERLIDHDTIRVYRVDHETGHVRADRVRGDVPGHRPSPTRRTCASPIGQGLTGWVAEHGGRSGSATRRGTRADRSSATTDEPGIDARSCRCVHAGRRPRRDRRDGHRARPVRRRRRGDADDLRRRAAVQALVNAGNVERLHRQQVELEHQLEGQRRLLDVNERLLSTLEPAGVLDLIADSLKAIVPYDSLTIYRVDRAAGVRRAVIARDRFAD